MSSPTFQSNEQYPFAINIDDSDFAESQRSSNVSRYDSDDGACKPLLHETVRLHGHMGKSIDYLSLLPPVASTTGPNTVPIIPIPSIRMSIRESGTFWDTVKIRSIYYLPLLQWLPYYSWKAFTKDLLSGLSLASLFIPQALSYATGLCRLPAIHGLYTISVSTVIYTFLGMSPQLSVGPEATVSLMVGSGISQQKAVSSEDAAAIASLTAFFVGLFTLALGLFRFGFLDSLMSRALLRGFITAVATVVLVQQTVFLLGLEATGERAGLTPESTTYERLAFLWVHWAEAHAATTLLSISTLLVLFSSPVIKRWFPRLQRIPEVLLLVVTSTVACHAFRLDLHGIEVLGQIGEGAVNAPLPLPAFPALPSGTDISGILVNAVMISTVGFVESIAIAKTFAQKHNYFVSANRELVAYGATNVFGSLFQAFPSFGSFPRSKIHESANPQTQMSGLVSGITTLVMTCFFLPYLFYLPKAILSSVIFMAVSSLLKELPHDLWFAWKVRAWQDMAMLATIFTMTMVHSLEMGTGLAVLFSMITTIRQASYPPITIMGRVKKTTYKFGPIHNWREKAEHLKDILIVRIDEPLSFANTSQLKDRLRRLERYGDMSIHPSEAPSRNDTLHHVIFDMGGMETVDASALQILLEIFKSYRGRSIHVFLVMVHPAVMNKLGRVGIFDIVRPNQIHREVADAIRAIEHVMAAVVIPACSAAPLAVS